MTCWKWFDKALKDAGIQVTAANQARLDHIIHKYIGDKATYGRCSAEWKSAKATFQGNPQKMQELLSQLRSVTR
jgi:hypothetical protein